MPIYVSIKEVAAIQLTSSHTVCKEMAEQIYLLKSDLSSPKPHTTCYDSAKGLALWALQNNNDPDWRKCPENRSGTTCTETHNFYQIPEEMPELIILNQQYLWVYDIR